MQLAFHHVSQRKKRATDDDVVDLALLDTETGRWRTLAGNAAWESPRWSADGRRVRFEARIPGGGFAWREVDVESGAVSDFVDEKPAAPNLPGDADRVRFSPARRWLVYRRQYGKLFVARADGSDAIPLEFEFDYFADGALWSPCGTKLAAGLTAAENTGTYVIDLRTGSFVRASPPRGNDPTLEANYFVSGWSPDGRWLAVTKNRWHDPKAYDYEWNELWLLAADGSEARQLTDDGVCRHPAIRPAGEPPPANGERELDLSWASPVREPREAEAAGVALAAQVRVDLEAGPPFIILLMVRTADGVVYPHVPDCQNIADGFVKLDAFLAAHDYEPGDDFTVVFPRYATDDPDDAAARHVGNLVFEEALKRNWRFDRDVPEPPAE